MYRIDLPNDDASRDLVREVLQGLAHRHNTDHAEVDAQHSTRPAFARCSVRGLERVTPYPSGPIEKLGSSIKTNPLTLYPLNYC